jgi:hypothetical protein
MDFVVRTERELMNDEQLTRLLRSLEEAAEPNSDFADSLFARLEREAGRGTARRRTSVRWVLLAAALLMIAAVGAALAVGSGLLKLPAIVSEASPTPLPSPSPILSPSPSPSASSTQTPPPVAVIPEPASIDKLVAIPDGFLAIGSAQGTNPPTSAVSVILQGTSDGASWRSIDASRFGQVVDGAVTPSAWVLLTNASPDLSGKWILKRSTDGQTWTSETAWAGEPNPTAPSAIVAGPAGFIIWSQFNTGTLPGKTTIWTSSDGAAWKRASVPWEVAAGAALDDGFLLRTSAGLFASSDGVDWHAVSSPNSPSGQGIRSLFIVGPNLVALTCEEVEPSSCKVWTSALQGSAGSLSLHWNAAADAQLLTGYTVTAAAGTTARGFMWGYDLTTYGRVAWTSSDGVHWSRTRLADDALGGGMPTGFAAGPSAVVAGAWTEGTDLGAGGELWQSADGVSWTATNAPLVPPPPQVPAGPCPSAPTTLQQLLDIGAAKAASCFGQTSLTVRAYSSDCGGCGGTGFPRHAPEWIANPGGASWYISTTPTSPGGPGTRMGVWPLPSAHLTPPAEGTPVEVTGHFNDSVSSTCRIIPFVGGTALPPTSVAVAGCRQAFVVTSIKVVGS